MIINFLKKTIPIQLQLFLRKRREFIREFKRDIYLKPEIRKIRSVQDNLVKELRNKEIINVIFLVIHDSVWKYEEVYKLLDKDPRFDVKVVIIPLVRDGKGDMETYNQTLGYFTNLNYLTLSSYDKDKDSWLDIKKITQPDIVFFTNPHGLTFDKYYIDEFKDRLTCYVPYAFVVIHNIKGHYDQNIHHLLWKHFLETKYHEVFALSYAKNTVKNIVVTGYPSLDKIFRKDFKPRSPWKMIKKETIKIIWAPHHTIPGQGNDLDYSSFMEYSSYFIKILKERKDIQIAFKPHPLLKEKLYADKLWGKEKTDIYYSIWDTLPNGQLEVGPYIDLFFFSDAMIMDSASFIAEYLYFNKPLCFTMKDDDVKNRFNSFGKMIFEFLYIAKDNSDVDSFINKIIIEKNDYLKDPRNRFLNETILPESGKTASENIYNEIIRELC